MELNIKQDLASNWFKILQDAICDDIYKIEKKKIKFRSTQGKRGEKKWSLERENEGIYCFGNCYCNSM